MAEFVSMRAAGVDDQEPARAHWQPRPRRGRALARGDERGGRRFKETLELAEIRMSAGRIASWTLVATLVVMWLPALVVGSPLFAIVGLGVPFVVRSLIYREARAEAEGCSPSSFRTTCKCSHRRSAPATASSARSRVVVDDAAEPSRTEFRRVVADEQLGVPLEEAVRRSSQRMDNDDLEQVALVAALQRRDGRQHGRGPRTRHRDDPRALRASADGSDADRPGPDVALDRVRPARWTPARDLGDQPGLHQRPLFTHDRRAGSCLIFAAVMVVSGSLVIKRIVNIKV